MPGKRPVGLRWAWLSAGWLLLAPGCCDDCRFPLENHAGHGAIDVFDLEEYTELFSPAEENWMGGELAASLVLPDGRTIWFAGRTCTESSARVANALVIEERGRLSVRVRGWSWHTSAWISPPDSACWYRPMHGLVNGDQVELLAGVFQTTGPGPMDWQLVRTDLVVLNLPNLTTIFSEPKVMSSTVLYGSSSFVQEGDYTYIYGFQDGSSSDYAHVARVPGSSLDGPWTFYDGTNWRSSEIYSRAQASAVSMHYGVFQHSDGYYLVSQEPSPSARITIRRATSPAGPWSGGHVVYTTLDAVRTYDVAVHRHLGTPEDLVLSYNLGTTGSACNGPVFLRVRGWDAAFE